jgi:predicted phosphodiesterase
MKSLSLLVSVITLLIMPFQKNNTERQPSVQAQEPLFTFGLIADVQYCNCEPAGTRFYRSSLVKLREAVSSLASDSVGFIVNLGDLIDRDIESFKPVLNILDSSGLKVYHVTGNHDYSVDQRFKRRLPLEQPDRDGFYSIDVHNFRLIFLNGNELSTYAPASRQAAKEAEELILSLKAENAPNSADWNGGIGKNQLEWLKKQLEESTLANRKAIIFCHFPIFPENAHNLLNNKELISTLENYHNVIAWFSGHNHSGNYGNFNYIHCVNMKGMVETETTNSFARVEIYHNKIWIHGSGRERSQILAY